MVIGFSYFLSGRAERKGEGGKGRGEGGERGGKEENVRDGEREREE